MNARRPRVRRSNRPSRSSAALSAASPRARARRPRSREPCRRAPLCFTRSFAYFTSGSRRGFARLPSQEGGGSPSARWKVLSAHSLRVDFGGNARRARRGARPLLWEMGTNERAPIPPTPIYHTPLFLLAWLVTRGARPRRPQALEEEEGPQEGEGKVRAAAGQVQPAAVDVRVRRVELFRRGDDGRDLCLARGFRFGRLQ